MKNQRKNAALIATGILIGSILGGGTALAASGILAERSTMPFIVNGAPAEVEAYLIDGANYLKLRDIAALADFGVFWNEESGTVAIDTMVGYAPEVGAKTQEKENEIPSAPNPVAMDYSTEANPAVLTVAYTREAYNALRHTIVTGTDSPAVAMSMETRTAMEEALAAIGMWPCYDRISAGGGGSYFIAKYPSAYDEAAVYCQPFIDSLAGLPDREKVRQMAFYVCDRLDYYAGASPTPRTVLVSDSISYGNCAAYSHNFQFLCDLAGIPCILVHSEDHQWNEVYVDGVWQSVDVTGADCLDVELRAKVEVLHDTSYLATGSHKQAQPALTRFAKELLVPGATK